MKTENTPTPHIAAKYGDFAPTVIMPGDPKRSEYIAEKFLEKPRLVNDVRGVKGFTGLFEGKPVSVMASGMGMPSMGIYSYELFNFYGVEAIIRAGSAGALSDSLKVRDVVLGQAACTDSAYLNQFSLSGSYSPICDFNLLLKAKAEADKAGLNVRAGNLLSSDAFYSDNTCALAGYKKMGVLAVEMEAAALYANAARVNKRALCICTISDCPFRQESLSALERERSFDDMCLLALRTAL